MQCGSGAHSGTPLRKCWFSSVGDNSHGVLKLTVNFVVCALHCTAVRRTKTQYSAMEKQGDSLMFSSLFSFNPMLQPLRWCWVDCVIHHDRDVREEQKYMHVARTSNNRVISSGDLYCCLLPQCEALRTCRSGFPIATPT